MATEIKLPRLGQGMDEGKILSWLKKEGDKVDKGDELYEVETEKVNIEVESPAAGTLLKIVVGDGTTVAIGTVLAWIGKKGEKIPESSAPAAAAAKPAAAAPAPAKTAAPAKAAPASAATPAAAPAPAATAPAATAAGDRIKASPLARRIAGERGLDLAALQGTGPDGRIIARDLEGVEASAASAGAAPVASSAAAAGPGVERIELTSMRRTIARRLGEAWQAPAFYLTRDIDMSETNALRKRMVANMVQGDVKPTVSDIIVRACAVALRRNRDMNVHFAGDAILRFDAVHVGLAVATDAGLVVPVIRDVHAKTVRDVAADRKVLVDKSRTGKLAPSDFEGGTFTVSNLGMMGIDEFTAVLNPPMAGILAVGRTADRVVAINRRPEVRPIMTVTLGCDHRAVDGAVGARFLQDLARNLEDPASMV